jgi:hypothetical protein
VELESHGVPTVALFTQAFDVLSSTVAKGVGFETLRRHVLPHPLNPLPEGEVKAIAREHMPAIVQKLLAGA